MAYDRWDDEDTYRPRRYGNDSDYGLAGAVFTADRERGLGVAAMVGRTRAR